MVLGQAYGVNTASQPAEAVLARGNLSSRAGDDSYQAETRVHHRRSPFISQLLVRNRRAARTRQMKDFVVIEAGFLTPLPEIGAAKIECVATFDEHIKRHQ